MTIENIGRVTKYGRFTPQRILQKLPLDTVGPLKKSHSGWKGFVLVTNYLSNYKMFFPIKKKYEVTPQLIKLLKRLVNHLDKKN